jgi:hypothetical protein
MPSPSSSSFRAAPILHRTDNSQRADGGRYLNSRHGVLNNSGPTFPVDRESTGRIITLSTGRFGVLAPRAPKERQRKPIGVVDSVDEGQRRLSDWRGGGKLIVAMVAWLASFLPHKRHAARVLGVGMTGIRRRSGAGK